MQFVFAVKFREALITPEFRDRHHQYIYTIVLNRKQKSLAVNGTADHIHVFAGLDTSCYMPDLLRDIKSDSSLFINQNKLSRKKFQWQEGYGAFSYSRSHRDRVIKYIINQEEHHRKKTFREEYLRLLEKMDVEYDTRYLFEFFQ